MKFVKEEKIRFSNRQSVGGEASGFVGEGIEPATVWNTGSLRRV